MLNMNGPVKMASYDMAGKTAVVTGGTKGIGKAIALAFGQCGANVVVAGRHEDECTAVAEGELLLRAVMVRVFDTDVRILR